MKAIIAIVFGMLLGAAVVLCLLRGSSVEQGFADRQKEHEAILAEAIAAKEAAQSNGRKLDFLIAEYLKNTNSDVGQKGGR